MNRAFAPLACCLILLSALSALADSGIVYEKKWMRQVAVHVITVDLNNPDIQVSPAVARHGIGTCESFGSMLSRLKPAAAITGTYFGVRSKVPVGQIVVDSKQINSGFVGTLVCFRTDGKVEFLQRKAAGLINLSDYPYAIASGPRLVTYGTVGVYPRDEGFKDPALYRKARRSALGVTRNNKLLLVTVDKPVYLNKLAAIMRELGAYQAVNLDGGSSSALHYKGRSICHPSRSMTNLIVVYESPAQFANIKQELVHSSIVLNATLKGKA